jgi:Fur family transcriptional regulator, ferric uptake regulator
MTSPPPKVDGAALLDRFRRYLRDHNLPVTHQRQAIAAAVFYGDGHLSVEDIERVLRADRVRIGKATVYRTLDLLVRAELVEEHDFGEGFKRYEPRNMHSHHEHIICRECGKVVEFTSDRIERMNMLIAEEYGFRHHNHRLEIYGVCQNCQQRDAVALQSGTITSRS